MGLMLALVTLRNKKGPHQGPGTVPAQLIMVQAHVCRYSILVPKCKIRIFAVKFLSHCLSFFFRTRPSALDLLDAMHDEEPWVIYTENLVTRCGGCLSQMMHCSLCRQGPHTPLFLCVCKVVFGGVRRYFLLGIWICIYLDSSIEMILFERRVYALKILGDSPRFAVGITK